MSFTHLSCPKCSEVIMKSAGSDTKVRCRVLIIRGDDVYSICKGCNSEVRVPLILDPGPPLVLET